MSKIDDMLAKYCPNGVEFRELHEIAKIGTGSSNRQDAKDNGEFPFYVRSKDVKKISAYEFDEQAIIIPGEGGYSHGIQRRY
jgi:type I restriction enzyme S subunit